jgi:hypothetical protein
MSQYICFSWVNVVFKQLAPTGLTVSQQLIVPIPDLNTFIIASVVRVFRTNGHLRGLAIFKELPYSVSCKSVYVDLKVEA